MQNLAFEFDRIDHNGQHYVHQRIWNDQAAQLSIFPYPTGAPFLGSTSLQSVTLLLRDNCEVVIFILDDKDLLEPGQWTFSLDVETQVFKQEMGAEWSGVTWRVVLARDGSSGLWELAFAWRPHHRLWEQDKREICNNNPSVSTIWGTAERVRSRPPGEYRPVAGRKALLLENGDAQTYMGPSP